MRQLRRCKRLWRRSLTRSHRRTSMGPSRSCCNGTTSTLQLEEITSKGTWVSRVYNQQTCPYEKKSGNLFNNPCIYNSSYREIFKETYIFRNYHNVVLGALSSLILSHQIFLSCITLSRSSRLHLVSVQSWYKSLLVTNTVKSIRERHLWVGSLLPQQYPACLICSSWIVFEMEG